MATVAVETRGSAPYDRMAYDTLPDLYDATRSLADRDGSKYIQSCIRDVFIRHGMTKSLVLQLLHRHFDMTEDERLVEYGPMQRPWPVPATQDTVEAGHILPKSWRIYKNEVQPFEFKYVPSNGEVKPDPVSFSNDFINDLAETLKEHELIDLLGIALADDQDAPGSSDLIEITMGRNSLMVPLAASTSPNSSPIVEAAWRFKHTTTDDASISTAHSSSGHPAPLDGVKAARRCSGHPAPLDGVEAARRCSGHPAPSFGVEAARRCSGHPAPLDGVEAARRCSGHPAPSFGVEAARRCSGHPAPLDGVEAARRCSGHPAPLDSA
ncbi:MAG: hypothetical protein M1819_004851 [Sarea resinae]|nr:MAG: hypothetical protein M1819_004851 [Sarea resinae]